MYIYIYIEREREKELTRGAQGVVLTRCVRLLCWPGALLALTPQSSSCVQTQQPRGRGAPAKHACNHRNKETQPEHWRTRNKLQ